VNGRLLKLEHPDIIFVQSIKHYLIIKTTKGDHITHMTMKSIVDLLPNASFRRIHRSYLVGILHITAIGRNQLILGHKHIPVGDSFRSALVDLV
jgi:two-component system LytT family response regulator